ncbi:MFS transporter [Bradyrhizobium sp. dw_411]|uniref:MFS transporter n=1 Tax=Bradyrhizobium sp. dw_411 TaxID=2720082 RepID=UPI001BCE7C35|nr:MFS transporter [Bradyrhizobium sp. dw_411]
MTATELSPRSTPHYAWVIVGVTFLTLLVTAGAMSTPGLLLISLQKEFGWSAATISTSLSLRLAVFGLMAPFAAALMLRFGMRRIMTLAVTITAIGMGLTAFVSQSWQLDLLWGLVVGGGTGMTALVLGATVANTWFAQRRGLVIGLMTASSASGQLLFLPLFAHINEIYGWRTLVTLVAGALLCLAPLIAFLMRNRPSDIGLTPYGSPAGTALAYAKPPADNPIIVSFRALKSAVRTKNFWLLFFGFFVCGLSTNGLIGTHLIAACGDHGIAEFMAAGLLALMGFFDLFGTVASGWLSDKYDNRVLLCIYYSLRGLSLLYLPFALGMDLFSVSMFAAFYGLDWFATLPPTIRLTTDRFGPAMAPLVFGWMFVGHQIGASIAAYGAGLTRTLDGTYAPAFALSGILCIVAGFASLGIDGNRKKDDAKTVLPAPSPA